MAQRNSTGNKSSLNRSSLVSVAKNIKLVVDGRHVGYSGIIPTEKSIAQSRKTYSKRNPIIYQTYCNKQPFVIRTCVTPQNLGKISGNSLSLMSKMPASNRMKISSTPTEVKTFRKRKRNPESVTSKVAASKRMKKNTSVAKSKIASQNVNANFSNQSGHKSVRSSPATPEPSSTDSDIEILEVKIYNPGSSNMKQMNYMAKKLPNGPNDVNKSRDNNHKAGGNSLKKKNSIKQTNEHALKPCSASDMSFVREASCTPVTALRSAILERSVAEATRAIIDSSNSMQWLSVNGSIAVAPSRCNNSAEASKKQAKCKKRCLSPKVKVLPKMQKGKRELKGLYENLNEISWTQETSFKNLLNNTNLTRHSERATGRIAGTGKNLRRLKIDSLSQQQPPKNRKIASKALAVKRSKTADFKRTIATKQVARNKSNALLKKIRKKLDGKKVVRNEHISAKNSTLKTKTSPLKISSIGKSGVLKTKAQNSAKVRVPVISNSGLQNTHSMSKKIGKFSSNNTKICTKIGAKTHAKDKVNNLKSSVNRKGNVVLNEKSEFSEACGSGLQNFRSICMSEASVKTTHSTNSSSVIKNVFKKFEKFGVSNEVELCRSILSGDEALYSALQRGSKLRVRLEPLEHTKLWTHDFYETFKKQFLQQALIKALAKRDPESITGTFNDLIESFVNPPNNIKVSKRKKPEEEALRSSVRQSEGAFRYKEIVVKKHQNYMQFVLVPNPSKQNCLSIEAMKELKDAFNLAKSNPNCRAVLLNSSGTFFCTGIDLSQLLGSNKKQVAEEMASTIRELVTTLAGFTKPVIAAVNGTAVGLGVTLLTFCDIVLASDKATFWIPATSLGYIPEGGVTLTLPQVVGAGVASEMLLQGRRLTAEQAYRHGLVSEVIWPTQLMNMAIPRIQTIVSQNLQVMEATKTMVRCHLWDKLPEHVDRELRQLPDYWLDAQCQGNMKKTLQKGWLSD